MGDGLAQEAAEWARLMPGGYRAWQIVADF